MKQGRKRKPDPEHATSILDLTRRGYTVNVRGERGVSSIGFTRRGDTIKAVQHQVTGTCPEWMDTLVTLLNRFAPDNITIITTTGENP